VAGDDLGSDLRLLVQLPIEAQVATFGSPTRDSSAIRSPDGGLHQRPASQDLTVLAVADSTEKAVRRLDSLTALRWFAALVVFTRHAWGGNVVGQHIFGQGADGVSFFFILSGFVLTWSYRSGDTAGAFYRRRFARVYPAFIVAAAIGVVLNDAFHPLKNVLLVVTMLQVWSTNPKTYFAINGVSWSLGCEAFFYLLFPLLIRRITKLDSGQRRVSLGAVIALSIIIQLAIHSPLQNTGTGFWFMYIFPPVRLLEFIAGMLMALELRDGTRIPVSLPAALVITAVAYLAAGSVPAYLMWVVLTLIPFCLLIYTAASSDLDRVPSFLRSRVLVRLGEISFAFYLLHQLALVALIKLLPHPNPALKLVVLAISIGAAAIMFECVERPLERRLRPGGGLPVSAGGTGHSN
jgi:peptidoglycan/LPS O-acetylase OafA/YrhL